jgi:hypothetical protein
MNVINSMDKVEKKSNSSEKWTHKYTTFEFDFLGNPHSVIPYRSLPIPNFEIIDVDNMNHICEQDDRTKCIFLIFLILINSMKVSDYFVIYIYSIYL